MIGDRNAEDLSPVWYRKVCMQILVFLKGEALGRCWEQGNRGVQLQEPGATIRPRRASLDLEIGRKVEHLPRLSLSVHGRSPGLITVRFGLGWFMGFLYPTVVVLERFRAFQRVFRAFQSVLERFQSVQTVDFVYSNRSYAEWCLRKKGCNDHQNATVNGLDVELFLQIPKGPAKLRNAVI